ncbi:MAG: response regulator [Oscillochloris sp.]|nr:response regulator [Oscillochloris sp.]
MDPQSLILVVDDQSRGRIALASLLEPEGYRLAFATNGLEALEQMRLVAPDLVLLDVMMPEMDGFEVCRRIRSNPALAMIPVLMITALDDQESLIQGIEAGADDFVTKPFNRAELRARVRTITRLNRFRTLLNEQRLVSSERAQFIWAIERSPDGYLLLDEQDLPLDGNQQGWHYLGLDQRPLNGHAMPFLQMIQRYYRLEPLEAWESWPASTPMARYLVRPEGAHSALWLQVQQFDLPEGMIGHRLVHLQDVTIRVSAQRHTWAFHSFVSHKLRTPLTSVLTGMGLMHQRMEQLPPDLAMLTETAYEGIQRLRGVIDDIFRYLDAPILLTEGGALLQQLPDLVAQIAAAIGIESIVLRADLDDALYRMKVGNRTLELLLTELLENALKFHPRGTPQVEVALRRSGEKISIAITDDGLSLSPAQLRRIWQPYHQIDEDFTGQVPGVGLGLTTVAQICWAAGGSCHITNRANCPGITVTLELPLELISDLGETMR